MNRANTTSGVLLHERVIPTPRLISAEARVFLAHEPPVGQGAEPTEITDKAAWRSYALASNKTLTQYAKVMAEPYPAETRTHNLADFQIYEVIPSNLDTERDERCVLYFHGGGFIVGGGDAAIYAAQPLASMMRMRVFSVDYRMAPEYPFPYGLNDCVEAYAWLLRRYKPNNISFYGASAGGNLAAACILKARNDAMPLPAVCALHSPGADSTNSGDSVETNLGLDVALTHRLDNLFLLYAGGHDPTDPLLSPIFADFSAGFPPTILATGTRDVLLSGTVVLHRALRRAGVDAQLHVWEAMSHVPFFGAPEEQELNSEMTTFLLAHLGIESPFKKASRAVLQGGAASERVHIQPSDLATKVTR